MFKGIILLLTLMFALFSNGQQLNLTYSNFDSSSVTILANNGFNTYIKKEYSDRNVLVKLDVSGNEIFSKEIDFAIKDFLDLETDFLILGDSVLYRFDKDGNKSWEYEFSSVGTLLNVPTLKLSELVADNLGYIYVTGAFSGESVSFNSVPVIKKQNGNNEGFIYKINKDGKVVKAINSSDGNFSWTAMLKVNKSDLYLVFESTIKKYDFDLNEKWAVTSEMHHDDIFHHIFIDKNDNVILVGEISDTMMYGNTKIYNSKKVSGFQLTDMFVLKINPVGQVLDVKTYATNSYDGLRSKAFMDANGNVTLVGSGLANSMSFGSFVINNALNFDYDIKNYEDDYQMGFMVKFDNNCIPIKAISLGGNYPTGAFSEGGNYYLGKTNLFFYDGYSDTTLLHYNVNTVFRPAVSLKIGIGKMSIKSYLIQYNSELNVVGIDSLDRVYLEGWLFESNKDGIICYPSILSYNDFQQYDSYLTICRKQVYNSSGNHTNVLLSINEHSTTGLTKKEHFSTLIYPNPSKGSFTISGAPIGQYSLVNELGAIDYSFEVKELVDQTIQIDNLSKGLYFLKGSDASFIKEKIVVID